MKRIGAVLAAALLLFGLPGPITASAQDVDLNVGQIPELRYPDWVFSEDLTTVTVGGKTYDRHVTLIRANGNTFWLYDWWADYVINPVWQKQHTPDEWEQQVDKYIHDQLESTAGLFPKWEVVLIDGRPWQESPYAEFYRSHIPESYHDLFRDTSLNGWLYEIIVKSMPAEEVTNLQPKDPVKVRRMHLYRTVADFALDGGLSYTGQKCREWIEVPVWRVAPGLMKPGGRVRIVMHLNDPRVQVSYFTGTPEEWARTLVLEQAPIAPEGHTLIPARAVFEALGATVTWDGAARQVRVERGDVQITLTVDSDEAVVRTLGPEERTEVRTMPQPAIVLNGRTLIPLRFVSETLGCEVGWDSSTKQVTIEGDSE